MKKHKNVHKNRPEGGSKVRSWDEAWNHCTGSSCTVYKCRGARTCLHAHIINYWNQIIQKYIRQIKYAWPCINVCSQGTQATGLHKEIQTDRQTDGQTGRHSDKQRDRKKGRHSDKQRDRQADRQRERLTERQTDGRKYGRTDRLPRLWLMNSKFLSRWLECSLSDFILLEDKFKVRCVIIPETDYEITHR